MSFAVGRVGSYGFPRSNQKIAVDEMPNNRYKLHK